MSSEWPSLIAFQCPVWVETLWSPQTFLMASHVLHYILLVGCCLWLCLSTTSARMNVLFLVSDDMRPELGFFQNTGDFPSPVHPAMHTPNLDRLAAQSLVLRRAYVQQAVCSPSRTSLLTGRRPDTTHVYDLVSYFRKVGGNYTTLPQYFKKYGYLSAGMGKIFHPGPATPHYDPLSWSVPFYAAPNQGYWFCNNHSWIAVPKSVYTAKPLPDQQITQHAIKTMRQLAPNARSGKQPFFMAVGFHKPHLPFTVPEEFFDLYPEDKINVPDNAYAPVNMPSVAWSSYGELRSYDDIAALNATGAPNTTLPGDVVRALRRAYYSGISYIDALVGDLLTELKSLGLTNNTIVSFWGDHGWQLGEHGEWCKLTNFDLSTHAPMMISIPGRTDHGIVTDQLTEFVDLYPTLVEAAGLPPLPICPEDSATKVEECREGTSLLPLLEGNITSWKDFAFSQYPRPGKIMGYTLRSVWYRYTEWVGFNYTTYKPNWNSLSGVELYDHKADPEENWNVADEPQYQGIKDSLSKALHQGWRKAMPSTIGHTWSVLPKSAHADIVPYRWVSAGKT